MPEQLFSGRRLSRGERREARRLAEARTRARAEALAHPAPLTLSATTRVADQALSAAGPRATAASVAGPPLFAARPVTPAPAAPMPWQGSAWAAVPPGASALGVAPVPGTALAGASDPGVVSRAIDSVEGSATGLAARVRGQWGSRSSTAAVLCGSLLSLAGLTVGLGVGGPVLGHAGQPVFALAGAAVLGGGALWFAKGWRHAGRRTRVVAAALTLLIGASFTVGTLTNPVVVDGQVFLATSSEAKSFRLMQQVRSDLLELASADTYLTYNAAQAGAHFEQYAPLLDRLTELSTKYATLAENPDQLPDERFGPLIEQTTAAAYWGARAMQTKIDVIEADNAGSQSLLATNRASYAEAVILSGETLRTLSAELDLPLTQMGPTE